MMFSFIWIFVCTFFYFIFLYFLFPNERGVIRIIRESALKTVKRK